MAIDSIQTQTLRNDQVKAALEHEGEKTARELKEKNKSELARLVEHHSAVKEDLEKAFEISLSTMSDTQGKRLAESRQAQEKQLNEEKEKGESELEKVRSRYAEQIARYKENAEKTLHEMQKRTDEAAANMKRAQEKGKA